MSVVADVALNGVHPTPQSELPPSGTNVLLVSLKRPRNFYERAAIELLASGVETVEISALGDAICTAVDVAGSLEKKKCAIITKIETKYQSRPFFRAGSRPPSSQPLSPDESEEARPPTTRDGDTIKTAGVHIILKRHEDFKGSRITPAHVTWCPKTETFTPVFNETAPADIFASVVAGNTSLSLTGGGQLKATADLLQSQSCNSHDVSSYEVAHRMALESAWEAYGKAAEEAEGGPLARPMRLTEITRDRLQTTDLKAVYCRPCIALYPSPDGAAPATGAVFVDVFADDKVPHSYPKNCAVVYVVSPSAEDFPQKDHFLSAVRKTAENLMTALCDYNGMVRRDEKQTPGLKRIVTVRICLFSGGVNIHPEVDRLDVAREIIAGLDAAFHYRASPRLNFAWCDDVFKQAWIDITGKAVPEKAVDDQSAVSMSTN